MRKREEAVFEHGPLRLTMKSLADLPYEELNNIKSENLAKMADIDAQLLTARQNRAIGNGYSDPDWYRDTLFARKKSGQLDAAINAEFSRRKSEGRDVSDGHRAARMQEDRLLAERRHRIDRLVTLAAACAGRRYHPDGKTYIEFCSPKTAAKWAIDTLAAIEASAAKEERP